MEDSTKSTYVTFLQSKPETQNSMILESFPLAIGDYKFTNNYITNKKNKDIFEQLVVFHFDKNDSGGFSLSDIDNKTENIVFAHIGDKVINKKRTNTTEQLFLDMPHKVQIGTSRKTISELTRNKIKNLTELHLNKWSSTNN